MPNQHCQGQPTRPKLDDSELPANFRIAHEGHVLVQPSADLDTFIEHDLSIKRIDIILQYLWLAGRPYPPRPLSVQTVLNRTTVPTNEASLHLVWASDKIYLKPLPRYILSDLFYEQYLKPVKPNDLALGLLFTYLALVPTELDFALAQKDHLIPPGYQWSDWKALVSRILRHYPDNAIYHSIHPRYVYGELRHGRLDKIHRYLRGGWLHGFSPLMGTNDYSDFLTENLGPIAAATVYLIVVLTAMQVVLATDALPGKGGAFGRASYGFAIFSLVAPLAAVAIILLVLVFMFFANWSRTTASKRKRFKEIGIEPPGVRKPHLTADSSTMELVRHRD